MMMVGGEAGHRCDPMAHVVPWTSSFDDPTVGIGYQLAAAGAGAGDYAHGESALAAALQRYLPCNGEEIDADDEDSDETDAAMDLYSSDEFRMYEFKVRRCARSRSHDWTECPFAHPGEKARRRDPRKYHYSGAACPDFRKGGCKRGDSCEYAHGVFECWLHPARYRTQPCKDGTACRRRVCFFAHTPDQLRVLPQQQQQTPSKSAAAAAVESYDGSPLRQQAIESYLSKHLISTSPTSTLLSPPLSPTADSPPMSPGNAALRRTSWPAGSSLNEILTSMRQLQLSKVNSLPSSWGLRAGNGMVYGSPRGTSAALRTGVCSLPGTPTAAAVGGAGSMGWFDGVDGGFGEGEEPVESGRALRAKIFEKLSKECVMERAGASTVVAAPDVAWVSDLVK